MQKINFVAVLSVLLLSGCLPIENSSAVQAAPAALPATDSLTAPVSSNDSPAGWTEAGLCIPSVTNLSFPVFIPESELPERFPGEAEIIPASPWIPVIQTPEVTYGAIRSMAVRDGNEIWISDTDSGILMFDPEEMDFFQPRIYNSTNPAYGDLYLSQSGELWLIGGVTEAGNTSSSIFLYRPETKSFERIEAIRQALSGETSIQAWASQPDGTLWIVYQENGRSRILTYQSAENIVGLIDIPTEYGPVSALAIHANGEIWGLASKANVVFEYMPETGDWIPYTGFDHLGDDIYTADEPLEYQTNYLFFDRQNRLWVSDRGWFEFTADGFPVWNRIVRSPVFIINDRPDSNQYSWKRPSGQTQSTDGIYWFEAYNGSVRLDPSSGEWCRFTTYSSPVVEDSSQSLWMVAGGTIFRYSLDSE